MPRLFVVQKHRARRLHYDLRLEIGGVLVSWAVPHGPSLDPAIKRLAVKVEDHPVEYADFEGIIPEGNYGAGAVIVWDRGTWVALEDIDEGFAKGKLLFELKGYKLRGVWTLVRTKRQSRKAGAKKEAKGSSESNEWLLIKKPDAYSAVEGERALGQASILSGLTVEELGKTNLVASKTEELRAELEHLGAPHKKVEARGVRPMLAEARDVPFSSSGWSFELKYDGFRLLASKAEGEPTLYYRRGMDSTKLFPDVARALRRLPFDRILLDGEVVVLSDDGRPSFQRLQKCVHLTRSSDIERAAVEHAATLFVFDILAFDDFDLRPLPLASRRSILQRIVPSAGPIRFSDHVEEQGEAFYAAVAKMGLEGIVAKKSDSPYVGSRSKHWLKIRVDRTDDFVVLGYTRAKEGRDGFGALHVGTFRAGQLAYAGRVGTGFSQKQLKEIKRHLDRLDPIATDRPSCSGVLPKGNDHVWVAPVTVCEVRYKEFTEDAHLRQPVFLRLRDDKRPEECVDDRDLGEGELEPERTPSAKTAKPSGKAEEGRVPYSNLNKVFFPEDGITKGDLIEYYRSISSWILPYLRDRPVVLTRYPDGIHGKSFFQKDAPPFIPGWVRTERMWSEHAAREIDYFVCDDVDTLLYVINLGSIPLHVWSSRLARIQCPDWCILDLDPKGAPFQHVVQVALAIRDLTLEMELETFIKTSGSTGLHILVPLGGQLTYAQSRSLGELISRVIADTLPAIATTVRAVGSRGGRVYLDYLQNGHGRLLVSPLCVRPLAGAPVSTPLRWSEVNEALEPKKFTIVTALGRLHRMGQDPLLGVLDTRPHLSRALERLGERVRR